jgi:hypothetical protein
MTSSTAQSNTKVPEADLLAREANAAQAAVFATMQDLKAGLSTAADPRLWAQQHPWASVGAAAVAGFAAAAIVVPPGERKLSDRLSAMLEGMQQLPRGVEAAAAAPSRAAMPGPLATIMESLVDVAKTAITNFVVAAVHQSAEAQGDLPPDHAADADYGVEMAEASSG